jgi:DNA-binding transcriptional LysR family regulator
MELRQLEYFVAVVEEASFTKAAARVHVAQPGVSAQVRRLERELGQELLDRSGRSVVPTQAGSAVLPYARAALAAVDGARLAVDEIAGLVRGHVAVGMVTACASLDLTNLLADFHRAHPGVEISLSEANSDQLLQDVRDGRLDMAWVGTAGPPAEGVDTHLIVEEPLVAAVHRTDPLAARTTITVERLHERALICLPVGTGLRTCLDDAFATAGLQPRIAFEASDPGVVARLAAQGLGVAVLPASVAEANRAELHALTVTRPRLKSRLELAWRAGGPASPAARELITQACWALSRQRQGRARSEATALSPPKAS